MDKSNINYLKKISDSYNKKNITDIFNSFRLLTPEYQAFNERVKTKTYSSIIYDQCTEEEKNEFVKDQLLTFESCVCNTIYEKYGFMYTWKDIYDLIKDPIYKRVEKINRKVVYSSSIPNRPIGDTAYNTWNGLQIIDLDIKDKKLSDQLKEILFNELSKYNWFLGICKSVSGKSLHVWTKITPISVKPENLRIEYLCNFRHKYSYIYIVLNKYAEKFGYSQEKIEDFMDMAMAKPQQGIFITSDENPIISTNFCDERLDTNFESAFDLGVESVDWISHPALKNIFSKLEWFNNESFDEKNNIELSQISNISDRDKTKNIKKHYKHAQRWQLANTLTNIYGYDKALQYMMEICKDTPYRELKGDVKTAKIHHKPISIWAIKELNNYHGFNIKLDGAQDYYKNKQESIDDLNKEIIETQNTGIEQTKKNLVEFKINKNQYLSDIKDDIIENLAHITLLEAGAGYGKTEMIKAFKAKTLLILPFTSTIKSKIEKSEVTEDWLYFYGNKRPTLDDLLGTRNLSMTIDKFSRLNLMELDQADFKYIVLDESHLLFTSSYRDVMAPTIQRLANCKAKIILMTGTPTGELTFFPEIKHIKVIKEDIRVKTFDLHFCPTSMEQLIEMCKMMADDIMAGRKILFPSNNGNLYFEEISGLVQDILDKNNFGRQMNAFYYKKSNYGDESMDNINFNKTIGINDLIMCTTYLSVGVDICDKYEFSVYFDKTWIPQDIEQFANRLRNNDLHIKMILPKLDDSGFPINYWVTYPLDLSFNKEDLLLARDLIRTCNDMLERNNEESKSNPLIQSLITANKYLKYDENFCKYYIDETMYKLKVFEDRYATYNKQLSVLLEGMRYYGYVLSQTDHQEMVSLERRDEIGEYMKSCRNKRYNENTVQTMILLNKINDGNIDLYREILKGNLEIMKGKDDLNTRIREENTIYADNIEVVEKNVPIILSLYRFYDINTIKDIYEYCIDTKYNKINYSKLTKIRKFISIVHNISKERLDFPIYKFVTDAKRWVTENPKVKRTEIDKYIADYSVKIANNVKDVAIDDVEYLKMIYNKIYELWKVIIIESKPNKNIITLSPFELLWEVKDNLDNVYGNSATRVFFMQELIDEMKDTDNIKSNIMTIPENATLPEIELTSKKTSSMIEDEIKNTVHQDYSYYKYSEEDGSNDRFLEKQKNTASIYDRIFVDPESEENKNDIIKNNETLEIPF